mmetsp:Transcript_34835/g.73066  ORF Transcript_34835/g.73066 Transcript_34835/m.73066 type:complete len:251 (-) Transcript_34835:812-1564(-)|eukprot:CAMPEP_0201220894 /NCGR_PEP_ID=MMETSP0851-20130426/191830_1 /ASSEMBLY_ACC=CAM_ASM_000631 /TAXON_ID=183588 /ORGANISM="Pseudo-nitzschia fraudulenta, Strain WWA7" /LENGTH=250 /DNA_ID=CAMNT_0047510633 /DNA_START=177 /DNA_END=929 /DNA_ORIENTATION=-
MWANKDKITHKRSANIKGYLGGFRSLPVDDEEDGIETGSLSSAAETNFIASNGPSVVSVLVEIPEELEAAHFPSRYDRKKNNGQQQQQHNRRASSKRDDSAAVAEIGNNIMDLDNYMLSVFHMNDDASIYTKSTADTSLSSSSSCTSASSTRRRHRGAFRNRMKEARQDDRDDDSVNNRTVTKRNEKGSTWLESMQKSSKTIFVEGKNGWTPTKGWHTTNESRGWDLKPGGSWNDIDPVFDSIKKQRLEI